MVIMHWLDPLLPPQYFSKKLKRKEATESIGSLLFIFNYLKINKLQLSCPEIG